MATHFDKAGLLERCKQAANHETLARTGATVQVERLVIDSGQECQLESVLPFRKFLTKSLHQVLDTVCERHDFILLLQKYKNYK
jgi:hypothetical protein